MQRRTKVLLLLVPLLSIAAGIILWLVWLPPWATPLEKRLLGAWEGNGTISGEFSLEIDPDLDRNVSGHKIAGTVTSDSTVQAEFSPDGTYTWYEQQQGQGASKGINISFRVPKEAGEPARWEVIRTRGNKLTLRLHHGEVVFKFQGENAFTMTLPESTYASGTIKFRRSTKPKE